MLGRHGDGEDHLAQLRRDRVHRGIKIETDLRIPRAVNARAVRRLVGAVFQVDTLQCKLWPGDGVAHVGGARVACCFLGRHDSFLGLMSGSRVPAASRAKSSSHPPTWTSSMNICGTV